ncbi:hypothetical protein RBY4I_1544 [Rhodobacterales bacterium Y4I]|nr:hypothetical protein RBY4I_1544 [Rhodobacterales bacterium Y4I]
MAPLAQAAASIHSLRVALLQASAELVCGELAGLRQPGCVPPAALAARPACIIPP